MTINNLDQKRNFHLFKGYDNIKQETLINQAVEGEINDKLSGGNSYVKIRYIESTLDFVDEQRSNISADISLAGLFGVNGKINFANSRQINTLSSSLLIYSKHVEGKYEIKNCKFKDGLSPEDTGSIKDYIWLYGDSFISSYSNSGVFWCMLTFNSKSVKEKNEVDAKIGGNAVVQSGEIDAQSGVSLKKALNETKVGYTMEFGVTGVSRPDLKKDISSILTYALRFLKIPLDSPVISDIETTGYEKLTKTGIFNKVAHNRNYLVGLNGLSKKRAQVIKLRKAIDFARNVYIRYNIPLTDEKINEAEQEALDDMKEIKNHFNKYEENPEVALKPFFPPSLSRGIPEVVFQIVSSDKFGGKGGGTLKNDFPNIRDVQENWKHLLPRIVSVKMHSGKPGGFLNIDATNVTGVCKLIVEYENMQRVAEEEAQVANAYKRFGGATRIHGQNDGDTTSGLLHLSSHKDSIKEIHVRSGVIVDWIKFIANEGSIDCGNSEGGTERKFVIGAHSFLSGFETNSGSIFDSVGFYTIKIREIHWENISNMERPRIPEPAVSLV